LANARFWTEHHTIYWQHDLSGSLGYTIEPMNDATPMNNPACDCTRQWWPCAVCITTSHHAKVLTPAMGSLPPSNLSIPRPSTTLGTLPTCPFHDQVRH